MDYNYAKTIKPDIIMLSSSAYGQTGPMAYEWGVDGTGLAMSGYLDQTGWPDQNAGWRQCTLRRCRTALY